MAFVVFEGLDGSGKTTLIKGLQSELENRGVSFVTTREPGGTALGEEIRRMLLRCEGETPLPKTELLLYEAGRAQHVNFVITPALGRNQWVICDRYSASSIAFQCGGRGLNRSEVDWLNAFATGDLKPDLYVLLDLSVEESQKRRQHRDADRFEKEAAQFHERVRQAYLREVERDPNRWLVLDASQSSPFSLEKLMNELQRKKWLA